VITIGAPVNGEVPGGSFVLPNGTIVIDSTPTGSTGINSDGTVRVGADDVIVLPPYNDPYVVPGSGTFDPSGPSVTLDNGTVVTLPAIPVVYATGGTLTVTNGVQAVGLTVATATAGGQAITYALKSGTLPANISLDAAGAITGATTASAGSFNITVRATAANGLYADLAWTITVVEVSSPDPAVTWDKIDKTVMIDLATYAVTEYPANYNVTNDPAAKTTHLYLRRVQSGGFMMGSPSTEPDYDTIMAQKSVTFTNAFYVGVFPVTESQYALVNGGSSSSALPAVGMSWTTLRGNVTASAAPTPTSWLGKLKTALANSGNAGLLAGLKFDLPTEAQWEYACRAGTTGTYSDGLGITSSSADCATRMESLGWYAGNSDGALHEVGKKKPNNAGLYDVHGNVWEWCRDRLAGPSAFPGGTEPLVDLPDTNCARRGGHRNASAELCRSGHRDVINTITATGTSTGFRLIATP
jgi:formylglycine-generating enzyme required for sulfatase activity